MKEYICKEDLIGVLERNRLKEYGYDAETYKSGYDTAFDIVDDEPTVTKADICREFLNKLATKYPKSLLELWETVDLMLAEMEDEI